MKNWHIKYWTGLGNKNPIEKWLNGLDEEQLESITKELKLLEQAGNTLRLPHSKALGKGLFELRERRYGLRMYYCFHGKQIIIVVASGDKKTQDKDIRIAYERFTQIK